MGPVCGQKGIEMGGSGAAEGAGLALNRSASTSGAGGGAPTGSSASIAPGASMLGAGTHAAATSFASPERSHGVMVYVRNHGDLLCAGEVSFQSINQLIN